MKRVIKKIIIHCSDSDFGDVKLIDQWHRQRGWDEIGYNYVILNGKRKSGDKYDNAIDGLIENGRDLEKRGAHCYGHNKDSIGICLVGKDGKYTAQQLYLGLPRLVKSLLNQLNLDVKDVYGHRDFNSGKACPDFEIDHLKNILKGEINLMF